MHSSKKIGSRNNSKVNPSTITKGYSLLRKFNRAQSKELFKHTLATFEAICNGALAIRNGDQEPLRLKKFQGQSIRETMIG